MRVSSSLELEYFLSLSPWCLYVANVTFCFQSSNLRLREGAITNRNNVISQVSFTRHFLVLVTGTPLVFLSAFTMLEAYSTFWLGKDDLQTRNYIICKQTTDGTDCSSPPNSVGFVAVSAIISVGFTSFAVLLLVFALSPRPARDLWMSHIRKILKKRTAEDRKHFTLELQESSTLPWDFRRWLAFL